MKTDDLEKQIRPNINADIVSRNEDIERMCITINGISFIIISQLEELLQLKAKK